MRIGLVFLANKCKPVVCNYLLRHDFEGSFRETFTGRLSYCRVGYSDRKYTDCALICQVRWRPVP
jgi:hypothetical protein